MKVAVSASGDNLEAQTDPRFGRCPWFVIVDPDSMEYHAIENTAAAAGSGAGIQAAQLVANTGAEAVVAGNMGPNAFMALSQGGLQVFLGGPGTVREAVEALKAGQLVPAGGPSVQAHFGMGAPGMAAGAPMGPQQGMPFMGPGGGMGMGGGRGMGMGRGRGMGMGGGGGMGMGPGMGGAGMAPAQEPQQELQALKSQAQMLSQQLDQIKSRIARIEEKQDTGNE